jgi:hypothetical protein
MAKLYGGESGKGSAVNPKTDEYHAMLCPTSKTLRTGTAQPTVNAVVSILSFDA